MYEYNTDVCYIIFPNSVAKPIELENPPKL